MTIHDKAIRLLEGGVVEIDGDTFLLKKEPADYYNFPCLKCDLDSICRNEHANVCAECDSISGMDCRLQLAHT